MNRRIRSPKNQAAAATAASEILLLPDGRLLVHNLTPAMARLLQEINPDDPQIRPRALPVTHPASHIPPATHELPN